MFISYFENKVKKFKEICLIFKHLNKRFKNAELDAALYKEVKFAFDKSFKLREYLT